MFTYYPFIKTIVLSFSLTDRAGNFTQWVGMANWLRVLSKPSFWKIVITTLKFSAMNLVFTFSIAMLFALLATNKVRFSKVYQVMYALPMAIASSPAVAIWMFIYRQNNGLLNQVLGTNLGWTKELTTALWSTAAVTIWMHIGASFIFLLVGFRNVPEELLESALIDGAGPLRRITSIIIPIASPQIFFVIFLNIINSFKSFAQIRLLTQGGPANATKTLIYSVYENAIINGRFETACVQALVLFAIIFLTTRIQFFFENRTVHYQ
ncbi:MAG: sugar ABC transporter permease [Oscillospiraceae bacterium]